MLYETPVLPIEDIPTTVMGSTCAGMFLIVLDLIAVIVGEFFPCGDIA